MDSEEPAYLTEVSTRWAVWGNPNDPEERGRCVMLLEAEPVEKGILESHWQRLYCMTGTYNQAMRKYHEIEGFAPYRPIPGFDDVRFG